MFTVKTKLGKSKIEGTGVFAEEFVPKGTLIWKYQEGFDSTTSDEQFEKLPKLAQDYLLHYGYYNKAEGGYVLCGDDARFTNHSSTPKMQALNKTDSIAIEDINIGEEITEDYNYFDEQAHLKGI
jgi:SET domain-containing protein